MKQFLQKNKKIVAVVFACLLIAGVTMSFQNIPFGPIGKLDTLTDTQDTIPVKPKNDEAKMSIHDFDMLLQNINNEVFKIQKEAGKIDFDKMHRDIAASLNKVDLDKINIEIEHAMKDVDFDKIEKGVKEALKEIDWDEINADIKTSLQEAKKEIEKIDIAAIKKEMQQAKLEIEKSKDEIKKINIDEIMKNANAGIAKSREELRLTKEMFNEMEKDGLIDQKAGFTIEYKDKTLTINGKKQSDSISNKYQRYIKGDNFKISISKERE